MYKKRPIYLTLHQIKLPLSGWVSILHRISGVLLFLALPALLLMLQYSLRSIASYTQLMEMLNHPLIKLLLLGLLWAGLHHLCAGIRYLAIDVGIGSGLAGSRASSKFVLILSLILTVLIGLKLC